MPRELRLTVSSGPAAGASFVVRDGEEAVFGRSSDCGRYRLPLGDQRIARRQFSVRVEAGRARLWDLGGTNPTRVNGRAMASDPSGAGDPGRPVSPPDGVAVDLHDGDVVLVGETPLQVRWASVGAIESPAPPADRRDREAVPPGKPPAGGLRFLASEGIPQVAGYQVVRRLGRGAGTTFLATRDGGPERPPVVLKILRSPAVLEEPARLRLERVLSALCSFRHPGAVPVVDFGLETRSGPGWNTRLVLEAEWWDAPDARALRQSRGAGLSVFELHALLRSAADTLVAAQGQGLSHLGLKPSNLLVRSGADGVEVRVTDFQVSWLAACGLTGWHASEPHLAEGRRFVSPRVRDQAGNAGPEDDVWSLAAVAAYLRYGGPDADFPDPGRPGAGARAVRHPSGTPRPVEALEDLLDAALSGRFPTMAGFLRAVDSLPRPARLRIG